MRSSVVLTLALVLVLCAALSVGDRRRSDGGQAQHRRRDGADDSREHHHHHHGSQGRQRYRGDDSDGDDSDEEDDGDDHHHHRFVELADSDGSHWRQGHDRGHGHGRVHGHEGRPESDGHGTKAAQNGRKNGGKNGQQDGRKDGKKDGQKKSKDRRGGGDSEDVRHHQGSGHREGNHRDEQHQHQHQHRGDTSSKKNFSKSAKQTSGRPEELHNPAHGPESPQIADPDSGELSPAAASVAAAMAASEADTALSAAEDDFGETAEPLPPPHQDVAAMARYIVHVSDWAAMATISTRPPTRGMPFANVFSVCDGTRYRSTGVPYLYLTDMEISVKDLRVNNSASLTMSLAQTEFCRRRGYDPEDPLCAHVILTGRVLQMDENDPEYVFARDALFARHPEMSGWPVGHHFFVAKLDIFNIIVLDYFGGAKTVPVAEYFATNPFKAHPRRENML
ncbi:Protein CREG1 [Amphibalanus amphitrite]|uniref:Protein CREG1 n=1 Tax=Amphibalanus amphitrite TaxID=1232801 RepID=A0A6A4WPM1_AMPAM|nr:Protein CREG1 [Amphibalanus amphitrite]